MACAAAVPAAVRRRGLRRDRRALAAVEFALVSMMMMTWIFGMMEIARAYWTYQIIQEVAILGARCMGVISNSCASGGAYSASAAKTYMVTQASNLGLTLPASDIAVTRPANCASMPGFSSVSINYTFKTNVPVMIPSLSSVTLTASSCYFNTQ
jgi:Flp pilus assembly protein TadG